ncbi:MAG: hypothetical protein V7L23_35050 [Nostoc sp.]|uniref:hypothetical protein n=1 Tax=Nostoc sp. TaxID=1180 RepID=UPI002FF112B2
MAVQLIRTYANSISKHFQLSQGIIKSPFLSQESRTVKQFWILDLQFGIDPDHKGTGLGDLRLIILDLFRLTSGGA